MSQWSECTTESLSLISDSLDFQPAAAGRWYVGLD